MDITRLAIAKLNLAPYNPRVDLKPDDPRYRSLVQSLDEFGLVQPLVVNRRGHVLVGGHQRLKVLLARGETATDVVLVDLSPEKEKALNLALNKVGGAWDDGKLAELLAELVKVPEIDLSTAGFDMAEIEQRIAPVLAAEDEDFDLKAELAAKRGTVTKPGELIELGLHGEHRILCADSTVSKETLRLFGDQRARLCLSDPPYGCSYDAASRPSSGTRASPKAAGRYPTRVRGDDLTATQYRTWFANVADQIKEALVPGASYYLWNGRSNFGLMHDLFVERGFKVANVLTWAKESFSPGFGDFNEQTEFCLYGWKGGAAHSWYGPKNESTLWQVHRDRTQGYRHPTQKPLELFERALRNSSKRGEIIFDPFLGSGTTLIAAARMGRRAFGMELEPFYCDVIVRRYIALAGEGAVSPAILERYRAKEQVS